MLHAYNIDADQPAHLRSLISIFLVRCLDSEIFYTCCIQNFKTLARFWSWAGWFGSYLVANPQRQVFSWREINLLWTGFSKKLKGADQGMQHLHVIKEYHKFPKYSDTQKLLCNHSKIWTMWHYHRVMSPNHTDGMANSVDPDQTARSSLIWVCTVCPDLSVWKLRNITVYTYLVE